MLKVSSCTNVEWVSIAIGRALYLGRREKRSLIKATPAGHTFNLLFSFPSPICALEFSGCGQYMATCCEDKTLTLWSRQLVCPDWIERTKCVIPKRATSLAFSIDGRHLLAANKGGDVMRYEMDSLESPDTSPLLGHCSVVLDMKCLSHFSLTYIATCDRDEKIRISNYPNSYNILTYCLGHKDFVSKISPCPVYGRLLVSGSGDGTIKVWDWYNGVLLDTVTVVSTDINTQTGGEEERDDDCMSPFITGLCCSSSNGGTLPVLAVTVSDHNTVYLYDLTETGKLTERDSIQLNGVPWTVEFCNEHKLWVGTQVNGEHPLIQCISISDNNKAFVCKDQWLDLINDTLSSAEDKVNLHSRDWSWLKKSDFDNMSSYYAKKNERLKSKKMKLDHSPSPSPPPSLEEQSTI